MCLAFHVLALEPVHSTGDLGHSSVRNSMKVNHCELNSCQQFQWLCVSCEGSKDVRESTERVKSIGSDGNAVAGYPRGRFHHAACVHESFVYIFGGKDRYSPLKDFWRLEIATQKWEQIEFKESKLPHLQGHTMLSYKSELLIFGGTFCDTNEEAPLWIFNTDINFVRKWSESGVAQPCGRREHSAVIYKNSMYIYGGFFDNSGSTDEFWVFNIEEELWQLIPRHKPGKRHGHVAVVVSNNMWLHGGMKELTALADFWAFNFSMCTWTKIKGVGMSPTLSNHTAHVFDNSLVLLGGTRAGQLMHDIWIFRFDTETWKQVTTQYGDVYPPLSLHTSVLLQASKMLAVNADHTRSVPLLGTKTALSMLETVRPQTSPAMDATDVSSPSTRQDRTLNVDILQMDTIEAGSTNEKERGDGFSLCSEAETSFSTMDCRSGRNTNDLDNAKKEFGGLLERSQRETARRLRPASVEHSSDDLPLLQRFHSVVSDVDMGENNMTLTISDENVDISGETDLFGNKILSTFTNLNSSAVATKDPNAFVLPGSSVCVVPRKCENNIPQVQKSSSKIFHQKKGNTQEVTSSKISSAVTNHHFVNPYYMELYDDIKPIHSEQSSVSQNSSTNMQSDTVSFEPRKFTIVPRDKTSPLRAKQSEDLTIEDLEFCDIEQLFKNVKLTSALTSSEGSLRDVSNLPHHVSGKELNNVMNKRFSESCGNLIPCGVSKDPLEYLPGFEKKCANESRNEWKHKVFNSVSNDVAKTTGLKQSVKVDQRFLYEASHHSKGTQTSAVRTDHTTRYNHFLTSKPGGEIFVSTVQDCSARATTPTPAKNSVLGDSELCIVLIGGLTDDPSFKIEPLKMWKCHIY